MAQKGPLHWPNLGLQALIYFTFNLLATFSTHSMVLLCFKLTKFIKIYEIAVKFVF